MSPKIPFIDLKRLVTHLNPHEVLKQWEQGLEGCEFVGGPSVGVFENALSNDLNVPHVVSCANGTDALLLSLQAKGIGSGKKVGLANLNFWASFEAVHHMGAQCVLIDSDPEDLHLSFEELKEAHSKFKLDALVMVNLFGWSSSQLQNIRDFCENEKIILIEDSAQAYGVEFKSKSIFENANISTLSFYPAKVLGSCGDAGAVLCQSEEDAKLVRKLGNHGRSDHYSYSHAGWNSRLSGLQARWLKMCLDKRDEILYTRLKAVEMYSNYLNDSKTFKVCRAPKDFKSNGYLMVLRADAAKRTELIEQAFSKGVDCKMVYPETIIEQAPAKNSLRVSDLKHSIQFTKEVVNPPMFSFIKEDEVKFCAEVLSSL